MTSEELLNKLKQNIAYKQKNSKEFSFKNKLVLSKIQRNIQENILHFINIYNSDFSKCRRNLDCLQLLDQAIKLNSSCLNLIKQGDILESSILYRNIVELCSVAIAIKKDNAFYEKFTSKKDFKSTKTFIISNKYIKEIGKIWGNLSELIIHINPEIHGTKSHFDDYGNIIAIESHITCLDEIGYPLQNTVIILNQLDLITSIILYTMEIIIFDIKDDGTYIYPNLNQIVINKSGAERYKAAFEKIF